METLKHTPGPWHTSREMLFDVWAEKPRPDAPRAIYKIVTQVRGPDEEEGEANARLIAAAPDLLAALRLTVTALGEHCLVDVLNPCWNARPNDVAGEHWGGGHACAVCCARAVIAKTMPT